MAQTASLNSFHRLIGNNDLDELFFTSNDQVSKSSVVSKIQNREPWKLDMMCLNKCNAETSMFLRKNQSLRDNSFGNSDQKN